MAFLASLGLISALLLVHEAEAYVLVTATLDDLQAIAKQIYDSPVVDQLNGFVRRASELFNKQVHAGRSQDDGKPHYPRSIPEDTDSSLETVLSTRSSFHRRNELHATQDNLKASSVTPEIKHKRTEKDRNSEDLKTKMEVRSSKEVEHEEVSKTDESDQNQETKFKVQERLNEKRSAHDEVVALGKNASFYLNAIKQIIENNTNI